MTEFRIAPIAVRDLSLGLRIPQQISDYIYFGYRSLEIWQRLMPFNYGSTDYDVCARCYARLAKLMSSSGSKLEIKQPSPASEILCNRMFHLAADRPGVAAELLGEVLSTFHHQISVIEWAQKKGRKVSPHAAFILRFSELADAFSGHIAGLWPRQAGAADAVSYARSFVSQLTLIYEREAASSFQT